MYVDQDVSTVLYAVLSIIIDLTFLDDPYFCLHCMCCISKPEMAIPILVSSPCHLNRE